MYIGEKKNISFKDKKKKIIIIKYIFGGAVNVAIVDFQKGHTHTKSAILHKTHT